MTAVYPVVMCTGHRDLSSHPARWARGQLITAIEQLRDRHGTRTAICGMAYGVDLHFGQAAYAAGLDVHAHIPYLQQAQPWTPHWREQWQHLRRLAAETVIYGDLSGAGDRRAAAIELLHERNLGMVDATVQAGGIALAVWDGRRTGGTFRTVQAIARARLPVTWINPAEREVRDRIPQHLLTEHA